MVRILCLSFMCLLVSISIETAVNSLKTDYKPSPLTKEEVLQNYLMAVTNTSSFMEAEKKIRSIQSMKMVSTFTPNQTQAHFKEIRYFNFPNQHAKQIYLKGNLMYASEFNGKEGIVLDKTIDADNLKKLSNKEIKDKRKLAAIFPEYSLLCNLPDVKLLGILDERNNHQFYVLEFDLKKDKITALYDTSTFLKIYSTKDLNKEKKAIKTTYSDYKNYDGFQFPEKVTITNYMSGQTYHLKHIQLNVALPDSLFDLKKNN